MSQRLARMYRIQLIFHACVLYDKERTVKIDWLEPGMVKVLCQMPRSTPSPIFHSFQHSSSFHPYSACDLYAQINLTSHIIIIYFCKFKNLKTYQVKIDKNYKQIGGLNYIIISSSSCNYVLCFGIFGLPPINKIKIKMEWNAANYSKNRATRKQQKRIFEIMMKLQVTCYYNTNPPIFLSELCQLSDFCVLFLTHLSLQYLI